MTDEDVKAPSSGPLVKQAAAPRSKAKTIGLLIFWVAVVAGLFFLASKLGIQEKLSELLTWIEGQGKAGPVIFIVVYALATTLFIPGSVLTLGAGVVFKVFWGTVYVSIASVAGATLSFLIGRYVARGWVEKKIEAVPKFAAVDAAVANEGWKIVALTRLSPVFPFVFLNYAYGLTKVSLPAFVLASWIFMLPGTVLYVYLGSIAGDVATLEGGGEANATGQWIFKIVGILATILVTVYITKIAKKALAERVPTDDAAGGGSGGAVGGEAEASA